jgi:DNA-binding transcriptional ArsR family regulator
LNPDDKDPKAAQRAYEAQMVRAAAHPVRARALSMMAERPTSPKEVAEAVEMPIGNALYHIKALEKGGLALLVEEKKRGGATEHFYIATNLDDEETARVEPRHRQLLAKMTLHRLIGDAAQAVESGTWISRPETHFSRVPLYLDEEGWREIGDICTRALDQILVAQARCAERLDESGVRGFRALAALLLFEMTGRPERD